VKNDVRVEAGAVALVRDAGKRLLLHLLDGFDFAAGGADFRGNLVEGVFHAFFTSRQVQDEQTFVSFHFFVSSFVGLIAPLNWLIAFCKPSLNQHSIWPVTRLKTFSSNSCSADSNRPSTWFVIARTSFFRPMPTRS